MLRVLRVVVCSAFKSGEAGKLLKESCRWAKGRLGSKRRKIGWRRQPAETAMASRDRRGKVRLIGGLLATALVIAGLLWMHQRLGVIEERLMDIEERQRANITTGE